MTTRRDWTTPVLSLLRTLTQHDIELISVDDEGDEPELLSQAKPLHRRREAMEIITSVDTSRLNIKFKDKTGWLLIILDDEPEDLVADWCPGDENTCLSAILDTAITEFTNRWEGKPCPRIQIDPTAA